MHKQTTPRKPCANHPICHRRRIRHRGALAATGFQERVRSEFHCRFQAQWERRAGLVTSKYFPGDGYTWISTTLPHLVLQPMEGNVQYKTEDIHNVNIYHYTPDTIVVLTESPFKTYQDLIAAAEVKPDSISIAGSGLVNSANHVANVRLEGAAGIKLTYVPFKGTGDLVASLLA